MRANGGERAVERAERRGHERLLGEVAGIGNQIARGEIVRAVGDHVVIADKRKRVLRTQSTPCFSTAT